MTSLSVGAKQGTGFAEIRASHHCIIMFYNCLSSFSLDVVTESCHGKKKFATVMQLNSLDQASVFAQDY